MNQEILKLVSIPYKVEITNYINVKDFCGLFGVNPDNNYSILAHNRNPLILSFIVCGHYSACKRPILTVFNRETKQWIVWNLSDRANTQKVLVCKNKINKTQLQQFIKSFNKNNQHKSTMSYTISDKPIDPTHRLTMRK